MGGDAPQAKASTSKSAFNSGQGPKLSVVTLPGFGKSISRNAGSSLSTTYEYDPEIQKMLDASKAGISANQGFINMTPTQQLQDLNAGNNSFFNLNSELNKRYLGQAQGDVRADYAARGLDNSTIAGATEASVLNDAVLRDLSTRFGALDYGNTTAAQNIGINSGLLGQVFGFGDSQNQQGMGTLLTAGQASQQENMQNAQMQTQVAMQNAQLQMQQKQARNAMIGQIIGAAATLGSAGLMAPMAGGSSLGGAMFGGLAKKFTGT